MPPADVVKAEAATIFKKQDPHLFGNCWPISLLTSIRKMHGWRNSWCREPSSASSRPRVQRNRYVALGGFSL